jgi:hypothetical protein
MKMTFNDIKIIKTMGHCYDGCGWNLCSFWAGHGSNMGGNPEGASRCLLFNGGVEKYKSEALHACNKIYGCDYDGRP